MVIRIIGGTVKGRVVKSTKFGPGSVRPILARIKKSLFDILQTRIPDARFLDLFAGTGAVGIEALSRGARTAVFLELDRGCCQIIEENLNGLGLSNKSAVYRADVTRPLRFLGREFDLIFFSPPYVLPSSKTEHATGGRKLKAGYYTASMLENIAASQILAPEGRVIAQHHAKEPLQVPPGWEMIRQETYGDSRLSFFRLLHPAGTPHP